LCAPEYAHSTTLLRGNLINILKEFRE